VAQDAFRVRRLPQRLSGNAGRTIMRFFWPGGEQRARKIIDRVQGLSDDGAAALLASTLKQFRAHHDDLEEVLDAHFEHASARVEVPAGLGPERRRLIGAYFTLEYAIESAALFNPSMVRAADQSGLEAGQTRFVMSLRAVGEGHVSSIVFRRGVIGAGGEIRLDPPSLNARPSRRVENRQFEKESFRLKVIEMGGYDLVLEDVLERLGDPFDLRQLHRALGQVRAGAENPARFDQVARSLSWLAESNYEIHGLSGAEVDLQQVVLFPISEAESKGMEDMRLVRFEEEDGRVCYYGTYTAYNGRQILPQLLEVPLRGALKVHALHGRCARDKGLALFPRKLDGWYAMIGRIDGENLFLMRSTNVCFWNEAEILQQPASPWEFVQIGNCGPPIETEAGWLLLTHGVGPMRRYCIGASLLDLKDPARVIGQLRRPLLRPTQDERTGYVPNVVYSCGGMVHNGLLIIPYGISDAATGFAEVPLDALLDRLAG
jgi:predicted GH43/DUF377 family glycosyl hydrolase